MTMYFRDGRFVSRIFYTELSGGGGNLVGFTFHDPGEPIVWNFVYRFRYYDDELGARKSADKVNWIHVTGQPGAPIALIMPTIQSIFALAGGGAYEEIIVESDRSDVQARRIMEQPWAHFEVRATTREHPNA